MKTYEGIPPGKCCAVVPIFIGRLEGFPDYLQAGKRRGRTNSELRNITTAIADAPKRTLY